MDYMDIDLLSEVPDTPDRLKDNSFANDHTKNESSTSVNNNIASEDCFDEACNEVCNEVYRSLLREKGKLVNHSGSRRLFSSSQNTSKPTLLASGESLSDINRLPYGEIIENKYTEHQNKHSNNARAIEKGKSVCSSHSQCPASKEGKIVVDLTKQNGRAQVLETVISSRAPRSDEFRRGSLSGKIPPLLITGDSSRKTSRNTSQVKEKVEYASKVGSSFDRGKGVNLTVGDLPKAGNTNSALLYSSTSFKVSGQKKLVRNGCISPLNIAKTKQSSESHNLRSVAKEGHYSSGNVASDSQSPSAVNIRDLVADGKDVHRFKGKGVSHHHFPSEDIDLRRMHLPRRSSVTIKEPAVSADASEGTFRCIEGSDGWRNTRNRTKNVDPPLADDDSHISRGKDDSCFLNQQNNDELSRRGHRNGRNARNVNGFLDEQGITSQNVSAPTLMLSQRAQRGQMLGRFNEHQRRTNTFTKRQRQGSISSTFAECSTSALNDPEIEFLSPPVVQSSSRSTRNHNLHGNGDWNSAIVVDELSPELRNSDSNVLRSSSEDSGVRARQVEADEMLARELQEQLYNELPGVGNEETDEDIALALLQEESLQNNAPIGAHHSYLPSGSSRANLPRHPRLQPSQGPPIRRTIPSRVHSSSRMAHLRGRGRFPGRSRTLSSSSRNSMFPTEMDIDMRMRILETLEAFSDMGVPNEMFQVDREFNEDDYEMLLALDDNNHQHGGASLGQINGLPQSTVQNANLEECSVCLETPTIGQTIRHLPCLHKFHKDCIDPWLRQKSSCPVCKSSIT